MTKDWLPLTEVPVDTEITIRRIHEFAEDNQDLLDFLAKNKVEPGHKAQVKENLPFNQTLTIDINGNSVTLGFAAAKYIFADLPTS